MLNPSANASHNLAQGSTSNLNRDDPEYDRRVKSFLARQPKRRRDESRVSSWSGVGSLEEHKQPAHKSTEGESEAESKRRMLRCSIQRWVHGSTKCLYTLTIVTDDIVFTTYILSETCVSFVRNGCESTWTFVAIY